MSINVLVQEAVNICGGQTALAKLCNVRQQHVWKWLRMKKVPAERAVAIERATGGRVTRYDLRPDIFEVIPYKKENHHGKTEVA